jgi:hypothetical protein
LAFDFAERLAGGELAFDSAEGVGALLAGDLAGTGSKTSARGGSGRLHIQVL